LQYLDFQGCSGVNHLDEAVIVKQDLVGSIDKLFHVRRSIKCQITGIRGEKISEVCISKEYVLFIVENNLFNEKARFHVTKCHNELSLQDIVVVKSGIKASSQIKSLKSKLQKPEYRKEQPTWRPFHPRSGPQMLFIHGRKKQRARHVSGREMTPW